MSKEFKVNLNPDCSVGPFSKRFFDAVSSGNLRVVESCFGDFLGLLDLDELVTLLFQAVDPLSEDQAAEIGQLALYVFCLEKNTDILRISERDLYEMHARFVTGLQLYIGFKLGWIIITDVFALDSTGFLVEITKEGLKNFNSWERFPEVLLIRLAHNLEGGI